MVIRVLPTNTINRIAAGEVIERPASAVKELVENALDAEATSVTIAIENGGRNYISITDNGYGMNKADLELSVERHATSKLPEDDLLHINHFGFRGEALPSIGSISRMKISSRARGEEEAWEINIEGGAKLAAKPSSLKEGTVVEIRDLFFATPARLKFLKSEKTETQHVVEIVNRLAMAHPDVAFSLISNNRPLLRFTNAQGDMLDARLKRITDIVGREFSENAIPLDAEREGIAITGFAGLPTFNKGTSASQYIFVNNRPVRDKLFLGAIRAAYQDFLSYDRHPVVALFLNVPPEEVDVNVHPAKAEVRFRESGTVRHLIVSALKHALAAAGFKASTTVSEQAISQLASNMQAARFFGGYSSQTSSPAMAEKLRQFQGPMNFSRPSELFSGAPVAEIIPVEELTEEESAFPLGAARCQLHETYIVAQTKNGIVIVDQHAAHERIVYEKMKVALASESVQTQKLLIPEMIEMEPSEILQLEEKMPELAAYGLLMEKLGDRALVVREVPAILQDVEVKSLVKDLADDLNETGEPLSLSGAVEHICGTIACHGSIRAGRKLTIPEMNFLLREMESIPHTGQCNHGRPTYVELKLNDIEKLFGRK